MHAVSSGSKIAVSCDGKGVISQAGGLLLTRTLRVTGLDVVLSAGLERWRLARAVHTTGGRSSPTWR